MAIGIYSKPRPSVPHPTIDLSVLLIVERAICAAWKRVRRLRREGFDLKTAGEDEITLELHQALYDTVFDRGVVPGFDRQLFTTITREPKIRSFDYKHPDKMPDLLIGLVGRAVTVVKTQDGLFVECKPIDTAHSLGAHYYKRGMRRFIKGEYAWAMRNALMVGYARKGYDPASKLGPALRSAKCRTAPTACSSSRLMPQSHAVHWTTHMRRFRYLETGVTAPPITLRHLWLKRD